jgi:hypothetical protein
MKDHVLLKATPSLQAYRDHLKLYEDKIIGTR